MSTKKIYITATVIDPETSEELNGWIDWSWSQFQLHDDREDVRYIEFDPEFDSSIEELIYQTIGDYEEPESHNPGRYYASDAQMNNEDGKLWSYCAHVED